MEYSRIIAFLSLSLFLLFIVGCTEPPYCGNDIVDEGETGANCCIDTGCSNNLKCVRNQCEPECGECEYLENDKCVKLSECCSNQEDCEEGYVCENHMCQEPVPEDTTNRDINYECTKNSDCKRDEFCEDNKCAKLECGKCQYIHGNKCIDYLSCDDKGVEIYLLNLKEAMENVTGVPLYDSSNYDRNSEYTENAKLAEEVGLDLKTFFTNTNIVGYQSKSFFNLFYTKAKAIGCDREYLVQRSKMTKSNYKRSGNPSVKTEYLVELIKLDSKKETIRPDQHRRDYNLNDYSKRHTKIELEIGCGEVYGLVEEIEWPELTTQNDYHRVKNYQSSPMYYDNVGFDFSTKYTIEFEFDEDGRYFFIVDELGLSYVR